MFKINNKVWFELHGNQWSGCMRCGSSNCSGFCTNLQSFQEIYSMGKLSPFAKWSLGQAKNSRNFSIQTQLEKILEPTIDHHFSEIWLKHQFDVVVMPLLRFRRIFKPSWHTTKIFYKGIDTLYYKKLAPYGHSLKVLSPWLFIPTSPQHVKNRTQRLQFLNNNPLRKVFWTKTIFGQINTQIKNPHLKTHPERVLFLDDVVTSGATLSFLAQQYEKKFCLLPSEKIAFTCYRTVHENPT